MRADLSLKPQPSTAGALFNRKAPRNAAGEVQPILDRRGNVREGVHNHVFSGGEDFTGLHDRSRFKYRIPATSVVNKVGDCKLFCCCGVRLTAAQILWLTHLFCFLAHTTMVFVVMWLSWWNKDMSQYGDENPYLVKVYRVSARWNNDTVQGYDMTIEDNGMPIDIAWGTIIFFLISAVFHLWALIFGLFESTWFWMWRQLDDAFAPWRWIEYSFSCSWMGLLLALTLGIREQNTLACFFMLLWTTQWLGFLNELYSRPQMIADKKNYRWPVGRLGFIEQPEYARDPNALHFLSQTHWEGDRPPRNQNGKIMAASFDYVGAQRTSNYIRRMVPYILGWFPFMAYVVCIVYHLEYQKWRLHEETNGDLQIPAWVNALLYGTVLLFSSFAFVMPVYQRLPPGFYWGSELIYAILSLTAKMYLGFTILFNVLMSADRAEDVLGAGSLQAR
jgi:hypothetical protein